MKGKLVVIFCVLLVALGLLLSSSLKNGYNMTSSTSPMSEFDTIADLQKSVGFTFQVPAVVANGSNKTMTNYMGTMVEIKTDDLEFRAAPFIDYNADISGDYTDFDIDNKYQSEDSSIYVRYRTNNIFTIISLKINDIAYSIKSNTVLTEDEAFELFGINKEALIDFDESQSASGNNNIDNENISNNVESNTNTEDLTFKMFENKDMGISFMVPNLSSNLFGIYNDNTLSVMMGNNVVFLVEYYLNGYDSSEFTGYTLIELNDKYLIRYIVSNNFEKGTQLYYDYYTLIENMDTVAKTFTYE